MSSENEKGQRSLPPALTPSMQLFYLSEGTAVATALSLAAELGIADLLADGPRGAAELARATSTHRQALYRLLRLLGSFGVFTEVEPGCFALTPLGERLRTGVPGSMRSWVRMAGFRAWLQTYAEALHSLRTGEPAIKRAVGAEFFDYLAAHPEEEALFNEAMMDFGQDVSVAVAQGYDFTGIGKVVDLGGGHGSLVTAILRANPGMTGILFDLPHVAESARGPIARAGLADRCEIVGGDFFSAVPAGADAYMLRWIIHDWDDERALKILRNCRSAMGKTARLLLVEAVIPPGDEPHLGKLMDFIMLTRVGGQERTGEEYGQLLEEAGFRLNRIVPTASPMSVIEGVPH